jgi:hypothetical protein
MDSGETLKISTSTERKRKKREENRGNRLEDL